MQVDCSATQLRRWQRRSIGESVRSLTPPSSRPTTPSPCAVLHPHCYQKRVRLRNTSQKLRNTSQITGNKKPRKSLIYGVLRVEKANFEHIQLHAAHGYFFSLIIDSSFSSKSELGIKLIEDWIARFRSPDIELSLRVSLTTGIKNIDSTRKIFLNTITKLDLNYFDLSDGFYNIDKRQIYPTTTKHINARHNASIKLSLRNPTKNFIISGKANTLPDTLLPSNISLGFCRDFIANPNFLVNPTFKCTDCMHCHYYSRSQSNITCKLWWKPFRKFNFRRYGDRLPL